MKAGTRRVLEISRRSLIRVEDSRSIRYAYARAMFKSLRRVVALGNAVRARFLGVPPLSTVAKEVRMRLYGVLSDSKDPFWTMRVLF